MSGDKLDFNNIETGALIIFFSFCKGAEGNSRHSDRNITGTFTIVCHRQTWVTRFRPALRFVLDDQNSDHPGDY
jgi:hypothetical protein